jgi:DNA polymerase-1
MGRMVSQKANHYGFIRLIDGARYRFDLWEDRDNWGSIPYPLETAKKAYSRIRRAHLHKALNGLIQGSAARQTKMAMLSCANAGYLPIIQMHDELGHNIRDRNRDKKIIREIMCDTIKLRVPMKVDAAFGKNWGSHAITWFEIIYFYALLCALFVGLIYLVVGLAWLIAFLWKRMFGSRGE